MKKRRWHTSFYKMTLFFVAFGVIPLVMISMVFFHWYYRDVESSIISNYSQVTEYIARNLNSLIASVDEVTGYMYDFSVKAGGDVKYLYEMIQEDEPVNKEQKIYIDGMLQDMHMGSEAISSLRFYTASGRAYTCFGKQGKTLQNPLNIMNEVVFTEADRKKMILMPVAVEADYCANSNDYMFTLVRNYLDARTVSSIEHQVLGTLYVDVDIEEISRIIETVEIGKHGQIHILNPETDQWLFSTRFAAEGIMGEPEVLSGLDGNVAAVISGSECWYFTHPVLETGYLVVLQVFTADFMDTYIKNRTYIAVVVGFAVLVLSVAYMIFADLLSEPARELKRGMERLQKGDLQVRVDIHSNDEMKYLGEGFNQMVGDLQYYIDQVYVANIRQKEAELNALKMQIQPHYLYNTLDVIRMTAVENGDEKTARLLESLARQLRYVIGQQQERVPLYMELNCIREYIVLMNARYEDKFQLNINVLEADRELRVLKLLLQPLVENCIKHGLKDKEGVGTIDVDIRHCGDDLEIIIMDDGQGMSKEQLAYIRQRLERSGEAATDDSGRLSLGFKNVYDRIKLSCGEEYGFTLTSYEGMGTRINLKLPVWEEDDDVENGDRG